ncbi:MAG: P-loop NTPase fold protein [Thiotrichales bacterium]
MASIGLRDLPVEQSADDSLKLDGYVNALTRFIMECQTPMTIAVQGDWGTGKTSMMKLVDQSIKANDRYRERSQTIWFNTWQYSQFDLGQHLPIALLTNFISELESCDSQGAVAALARTAKKVLRAVSKNAASLAVVGLTGSIEGAQGVGSTVDEAFNGDATNQLVRLKENLREIVRKRLDQIESKENGVADKTQQARIVLFIDDLDRLVPVRAVELLEVFKLFLDIPGCVFVLACDYEVITHGLEEKFGQGKGRYFFDKIIQLPFSMPVSHYDLGSYTKRLLDQIGLGHEGDHDMGIYENLIRFSVGTNPRSMKRVFNSLQLLNFVAENRGILVDDEVARKTERSRILLAIVCMQTAFESIYRDLVGRSKEDLLGNGLPDYVAEPSDEESLNAPWLIGLSEMDKGRLEDFIGAFWDAIQLDSDGDSEHLSEGEVNVLLSALGLTSVTSIAAVAVDESDYATDRMKLKAALNDLVEEFSDQYHLDLKKLKTELKLGAMGRSGNLYGSIEFRKGVKLTPKLLDRKVINLHIQFDDVKEFYGIYASSGHPEWMEGLLDPVFSERFQNARLCDGDYYLFEQSDHFESRSVDNRIERFKTDARQWFEVVVEGLLEIRDEGR